VKGCATRITTTSSSSHSHRDFARYHIRMKLKPGVNEAGKTFEAGLPEVRLSSVKSDTLLVRFQRVSHSD